MRLLTSVGRVTVLAVKTKEPSAEDQMHTNIRQNEEEESLKKSCLAINAGDISSGFQFFSAAFSLLCFVVIGISLVYWYRHRNLFYLRRRSFYHACLAGIGLMFHTVGGSLNRASQTHPNFIHQCFVFNFSIAIAFLTALLICLVKMLLFRNRYVYNLKLSHHFVQANKKQSRSVLTQAKTEVTKNLAWLAFFSTERFGFCCNTFGMTIACVLSAMLAALTCPGYRPSPELCALITAGSLEALVVGIPGLLCACWCFMLLFQTRKFPDILGILREVKWSLLTIVSWGGVGILLSLIDPGDFLERSELVFDYAILVDIGFLWFFCYLVPYQVYKAVKQKLVIYENVISLEQLLQNKIGSSIFRSHLIHELSVENLNFYEVVQVYRKMFDGEKNYSDEERRKIAKEITDVYIIGSMDGYSQININHELSLAITTRLKAPTPVPKDIFEEAYLEIYGLMRSDSYFRFKSTRQYKDFISAAEITAASDPSL